MNIQTARMVITPEFMLVDGYPKLSSMEQTEPDIIKLPSSERKGFVGRLPDKDTEVCHIALEYIDGKYEIDYGTEPGFRRNGYMSEALPVVISWLYTNTKINTLYARTCDNPPSEHLLLKSGFQETEEAYPKPGKLYKFEKR